jgi:spermidine/putrescine transport system permease protein
LTDTSALAPGRNRRRELNPLEYLKRPWMQLTLFASFIFLYFPIVTLVAFSFNDSKRNITWRGFTWKYYEKAFNNQSLHDAFINSMIVAGISTVVSTALGAMLGLALNRYRFPLKGTYEGVAHLPIVIPEICMGVAMLVFFNAIGMDLSLTTITVSHIAFTIPFVAVVIRARMVGFDISLEEASRDLGASEWQTFWYVTFPYMVPGLVAGALMAFVLSLDDFVITFFTAGVGDNTLPVKIYSMLRFSVTPEVNAASTVLIVITLTLTLVALVMQSRWGKENHQ